MRGEEARAVFDDGRAEVLDVVKRLFLGETSSDEELLGGALLEWTRLVGPLPWGDRCTRSRSAAARRERTCRSIPRESACPRRQRKTSHSPYTELTRPPLPLLPVRPTRAEMLRLRANHRRVLQVVDRCRLRREELARVPLGVSDRDTEDRSGRGAARPEQLLQCRLDPLGRSACSGRDRLQPDQFCPVTDVCRTPRHISSVVPSPQTT
jgi:hypothetical protein